MKKGYLTLLFAALITVQPGTASFALEPFSFYGLTFGMTREEVRTIYPSLSQGQVREPGHGMLTLETFFDREELLLEIRASYIKPEDKVQDIALKRALREKFVSQVRTRYPSIDVNTDEFLNRGAITLIFQSSGIREKNIEFYKLEYLKTME